MAKRTSNEEDERKFILDNFRKLDCSHFIPDPDNLHEDRQPRCQCGRPKHGFSGGQEKEWDVENCTDGSQKTDAFGWIKFAGTAASESTARYIRLSSKKSDTDTEDILRLMENHWMKGKKKTRPDVIITVTGGAGDFHIESHIREAFARGLSNMTTKSNAWVTTGGQYRGVMKMVGQALRNVYDKEKHRVPCIGFCQWGFMRDRKELENKEDRKIVRYKAKDGGISGNKDSVSLDPNHTHFIIVDNGTEGKEYGEYELYNDVKEAMKESWKVPMMTILLGANDRGPLENVDRTLDKKLPVVIMKGTGGVADLLIFALKELIEREEKEWYSAIWKHVIEAFGKDHKEFDDFVKGTLECMRKFRDNKNDSLVAVFDASNERDIRLGLDFTVLKLLITHASEQSVRLALNWNRDDILQELLLFQSLHLEDTNEWHALMDTALLEEKEEFVKLFIEHSVVDLKDYLTETKLQYLYDKKNDGPRALDYICSDTEDNKFEETCRLLLGERPDILPDWKTVFIEDTDNDVEKFRLLFIWALLTERWKLAKVFWAYGPEPVAAALAAGLILRKMANLLKSDHTREPIRKTLRSQRRVWAARAYKLLEACYEEDRDETELLVTCTSEKWGGRTPLKMAVDLKSYEFVGHPVVQYVVSKAWMGQLQTQTATLKIILSTHFPLFLGMIKLEPEKNKQVTREGQTSETEQHATSRKSQANKREKDKDKRNKLTAVYCSPVGKYWLNFTSYLLFLAFFSYSLLVRWDSCSPTLSEILTTAWVVSIFIEDVEQMYRATRSPSAKKLIVRKPKMFTILKIASFLLYLMGVAFRYTPHNSDDVYPTTFRLARILLSIDICLFFVRGSELFFINKDLGPKLTMTYKMMRDVVAFVGILLVFLLSYGVAVQALLFPFQEPSWRILANVVYEPFFHIYGELFLELYQGEKDGCVSFHDMVGNGTRSDVTVCPQQEWLVWALLIVYLVTTTLVLLNLLIAIFNNTYTEIENESELLWKYQRHNLVSGFVDKSVFPHPIAWISLPLRLIMKCRKCQDTAKKELSALRVERLGSDPSDARFKSMEFLEGYSVRMVSKEVEM